MIYPPYCIQIELVEGCNLRCDFCGINGIRGPERVYNYMEPRVLRQVMNDIVAAGWNPRIEFAMHGEPTLHPKLLRMIKITKARLGDKASIMITTNGVGLVKQWSVQDLFDAGVNCVAVDDYDGVKYAGKIKDQWGPDFLVYPDSSEASPYKRWNGKQQLVILRDLSANPTTVRKLGNHCGAAKPLDNCKAGIRCSLPFREMSIRWDGGVAICCNDWRGVYGVGNVMNLGVLGCWESQEMEVARRFLYAGRRELAPCLGCNVVRTRLGLLPDPKGKETLPAPDASDIAAWRATISRKPLSDIVILRSWEKSLAR